MTSFQQRVYERLREVPSGRVTTYAHLAAAVGCGSPRAVGQALRRNPFAPEVPCHRVVKADLTPGGFQGHAAGAARQRKTRLLAQEGVLFQNGRLREAWRVYTFVTGKKAEAAAI